MDTHHFRAVINLIDTMLGRLEQDLKAVRSQERALTASTLALRQLIDDAMREPLYRDYLYRWWFYCGNIRADPLGYREFRQLLDTYEPLKNDFNISKQNDDSAKPSDKLRRLAKSLGYDADLIEEDLRAQSRPDLFL